MGINKVYLFFNILTVSLGFMQFGVGMNSWSNSQPAFAYKLDWDKDQEKVLGDVCQSIIIFGAACGALSCSYLLGLGKYRVLLLLNVVITVGVGISLIGQWLWLICLGRLIWGYAFGAFSVVCAKTVNELLPVELGGSFGAINQMSLCFGAALPGTFALAYPTKFDGLDKDSFYVVVYWRIIFCLPIVVSLIQVLLLLTVFNYETPVHLHEKGMHDDLMRVLKKIYNDPDEIKYRLDQLQNAANAQKQNSGEKEAGMVATFTDPSIRSAAWVGFFFSTFQQLTGMNAIMFYSGQLFGTDPDDPDAKGLSTAQASCLINWANFIAAGCGAVMLGFFGRKTLMVGSQAFCVIGMFGMWLFMEVVENEAMMYVLTIAFIFGFEFGPGPICWLYLSEICNNQATSVNTVVNWIWTLVISLVTPLLFDAIEGQTWLIFGCTSIVGFIFFVICMKETKGLTKEQCKALYMKQE